MDYYFDDLFAGLFIGLINFFFAYSIIIIILAALILIGQWKVFEKAGKPGWASFIPIYSTIVLLEIIGRPTWWLILTFFPIANVIVMAIMMIDLARVFGKDTGFAIGLILLNSVFMPILGFSNARYQGPIAGQYSREIIKNEQFYSEDPLHQQSENPQYQPPRNEEYPQYQPNNQQNYPQYQPVPRAEPSKPYVAPRPNKPKIRAWLVSDHSGHSHQLCSGITTIGRSQDNDICLENSRVSKHHAKITEQNGHFYILDLSSTNGTRVNGKFIRKTTLLYPGDQIFFGDQYSAHFRV